MTLFAPRGCSKAEQESVVYVPKRLQMIGIANVLVQLNFVHGGVQVQQGKESVLWSRRYVMLISCAICLCAAVSKCAFTVAERGRIASYRGGRDFFIFSRALC